MKRILTLLALVALLESCGKQGTGEATENPSAIDTTQHGTGITNQNVISTDTAAMRVDTTKVPE